MAYRTRRENRYLKLRQAGFLPFEARPLSRIPTKVCPYLRSMTTERRQQMRKARKMGRTRTDFEKSIKEMYRVNDWMKKNRVGKSVADPWQMLRDAEDKFKAKKPQYDSPWEKRWKDWRNFQSKVEKTLKKQGAFA